MEEGEVATGMSGFGPKDGGPEDAGFLREPVWTLEGKLDAWVVTWDKGGKDVGSWAESHC